MLNFIGFINDNTNLTTPQKFALLEDFCAAFGFAGTIAEQREYANERITKFIVEAVHSARRREAAIEQLELTDGTVVLP